MINSKTKTISILLMLLLAFVGCTQPDMQEDLKTLQPVEKGEPVVAVINLPGAGTQTRTILPGELDLAHHYTITLTNDTLEMPIVKENITASGNQLKLVNVPVGKYNVHIDGHNEAGQIMLKGDGDKILDITLDSIAEVTVELFPQYGPEMKGSIEVSFNWNAVVNSESSTPSDSKEEETVGPLKKAIEEGYLEFELYTGEIGGLLHKTGNAGESAIWTNTGSTSHTVRFNEVPTGKDIYVALTIKDSSGNAIIDKQYGITAQVYADQVSYYNGDKNYSIPLGKDQDQWYSNVSNVKVTYPAENADTTFIINWDDIRRGNNSIFSEIRFSYGLYNVADGERNEKTLAPFKPTQSREDNKITVSGLDPNAEYYIKSQAVSKGGKLSNTLTWTLAPNRGFKTKVNLGGITFDPQYALPETKVVGDAFEIKANIQNANATYPDLEYKVVDLAKSPEFVSSHDAIFYINNPEDTDTPAVITANRPGVAKIEATNNDLNDKDHSKTTDGYVKVTLGQPINLNHAITMDERTAQRGINLSWNPVSHAEKYIVYRSDNSGSFQALEEQPTSPFFTDGNLLTNHTYQYKVVAVAPSIDAEYSDYSFSANSAESALTEVIKIEPPVITLKPTVIKDNKFELSEVTTPEEGNHVYTDIDKTTGNINLFIALAAGESRTVGIENEIPGFNQYTWLADNEIIIRGTFDEANTIVLSDKLEQLDPGLLGAHTITFSAKNTSTGDTFSANIGLTLVRFPVKEVKADLHYGNGAATGKRFSTADNVEVRIAGTAFAANGQTPSVQTVQYRIVPVAEDSIMTNDSIEDINAIAAIDPYSGVITVKGSGDLEFEAYSPENETIHARIALSFYEPTITSVSSLVEEFNKAFTPILKLANTYMENDWWWVKSYKYSNSGIDFYCNVGGGGVNIAEPQNGGIDFHGNGFTTTLGTIGNVKITSAEPIRIEGEGSYGWQGFSKENPLYLIGVGENKNTIDIQLPNNQGMAHIKFVNIDVYNSTANGSYVVTFDNEILFAPKQQIDKGPHTINAVDVGRPAVK